MEPALDVVIVADTSRYALRMMTDKTIESCRKSEGMKFNFVIVDGNKATRGFSGCRTVTYDFEFNYNRCLNLGAKFCKGKWIAFCNNDLEFHAYWASNILNTMNTENLKSASPNQHWSGIKGAIEGYLVSKHLLGWCLVVHKDVLEKIGGFETPCKFWYSDNVYAEQLKKHGIKHGLVLNSHVTHIGSKTLRVAHYKRGLTMDQRKIFDNWKDKYWKVEKDFDLSYE